MRAARSFSDKPRRPRVRVGKHTNPAPLITLTIIAALVSLYVFKYVPRLERREAEELASRRAARAAARAARAARAAQQASA